jgi:hypothetical protein
MAASRAIAAKSGQTPVEQKDRLAAASPKSN